MSSKADHSNQQIVILLYCCSFFAGMGIEMPIVNFVGNFGIGDVFFIAALFFQIYAVCVEY